MKTFLRWVAVIILLAVALGHMFKPALISLDWPTVVLLMGAVILATLETISRIIKSLKVGNTEVQFQQLGQELKESVAKVIEAKPANPLLEQALKTEGKAPSMRSRTLDAMPKVLQDSLRFAEPDEEGEILALAHENKPMAIIYTAIEIEKLIRELNKKYGTPQALPTMQSMMQSLWLNGILSNELKAAIENFWKFRNAVVYADDRYHTNELNDAIDSGVTVFRILKALNTLPKKEAETQR